MWENCLIIMITSSLSLWSPPFFPAAKQPNTMILPPPYFTAGMFLRFILHTGFSLKKQKSPFPSFFVVACNRPSFFCFSTDFAFLIFNRITLIFNLKNTNNDRKNYQKRFKLIKDFFFLNWDTSQAWPLHEAVHMNASRSSVFMCVKGVTSTLMSVSAVLDLCDLVEPFGLCWDNLFCWQ